MTDLIKSRLRFGPFEVDLSARELRKSGTRIKLSGQPFEILAALLEHPGQLVSRDDLRKRIWSEDTFVDFGHGLNAAVNKLREALCDSASDPRYIETLPRRGYRFIAIVEEAQSANSSLPVVRPVVARPSWKGFLMEDEWESTVPKGTNLVQAGALLALFLLFAFGMTRAWFGLHDSPSNQEAELRLQRAQASSAGRESPVQPQAETHVAHGEIALHPESLEQNRKQVVESSVSDDSDILRLEDVGPHLQLTHERSFAENPAILRFDLAHANDANAVRRIVSGEESIAGPEPSPDGKKLVYMAGQMEAMEIWVCNSDGSSPKKLTNMGRTGTPRWSPDGRWIVFDSDGRFGRSGIYVVSADGGPVRAVVADETNNSVPSWSRDGKYIYFASNRAEGWPGDEVWKVPAEGGQPVQITYHGGFSAYESADGKWLYYAKTRNANPEVWQVPVDGGTEARVPLLHPSTWASWALTDRGILLLSEYRGQKSELEYFDFATHSIHSLATLERASFWLASSASGSSVWYSELTDYEAHKVFKAGLD
jgi:DNA-binding winged helix-turn-helix (wHTH) protein